MPAMSEKSILSSRFYSCLIALSTFLLMISSIFLLHSNDNLFEDGSFLKSFILNTTPSSFKPCIKSEHHHVSKTSDMKQPVITQEVVCEIIKEKNSGCSPNTAILKVYMYDLPPDFHFGLLGWAPTGDQKWPNVSDPSQVPPYPGSLNLQHSMEYWLTLDLLASKNPNADRPCSAVRVSDPGLADVIFVPFFASLSYNRHSRVGEKDRVSLNRVLQGKLVNFLKDREEWKRFGGSDHLIVAHHPNSLLLARKKLGSAMFVLADFGRYPMEIANLEKDIIAPYKHLVKTVGDNNSLPFEERPILAYFQGAIYRKEGGAIRQELYYLLKDEKDIHFSFGTTQSNGIRAAGRGMSSSKFCLNIAGDTPSSNRLFDSIVSRCVPVIISDDIELPFEDIIDYSRFSVFVRSSDAVKKGYLLNLLWGIGREEWTEMYEGLKAVVPHFEYGYPSQPGDAVDMIWQAVLRKRSTARFENHRKNRYRRSLSLAEKLASK